MDKKCKNCDNVFNTFNSKKTFCNSHCKNQFYYRQNNGILNIRKKLRYRDAVTKYKENIVEKVRSYREKKKIIDRIYYDLDKYGGNRIKALERDRFACVDCGVTEDLTVHHIDKTGQSKNPNNYMNNLVTLCRKCHRNHHKSGGVLLTNCVFCGKEYEAHRHDVANGKHKYCSKQCCDSDRVGKLKTAFYDNCVLCGKEFKTTAYKRSVGKGKYCSQKCSQESQRKRICVKCLYCDKEFETIDAKIKQGRGKFCSPRCSGIFNRQKQLKMNGSQ